MANFEVLTFAEFDDFKAHLESLDSQSNIDWGYVEEKGYILIVG